MTNLSTNLCQFLEWDSDFFGYQIAKVISHTITAEQATRINDWCIDNKIDCLYFLAVSDDAVTMHFAGDNQYRFVDIRHVYEMDILRWESSVNGITDDFMVDIATARDTQELLPMIDNAFTNTRFYYDPYFRDEQANNLYRTWLDRSINEDFADHVIVIRKQGKPQGFITCNLDHDTKVGTIGLIGVADYARGKNLGAILVFQSIDYFKQEGMNQVRVVTQVRNIAANRLYQKCGFRTSEVYLWYHKWFIHNP